MKISCPSCSAKYSIADDKVQSRLAKIRCRKCGTSIVIDGNANPPSVYAATEGERASVEVGISPQGTSFSVDFGEGDQRQLTVAQLVEAYNAGTVSVDTYLWAEGYADWTPLGQVDEIVSALHRAAASVDSNAAAAMSTAVEDPFPQPPAKSGADLFAAGRPATNANRDFASSAPQQRGATAVQPSATAVRNESSVLFSLSALTSGSSSSRPSVPAPASPVGDDSGLIDLKALTEAAAAQAPRATFAASAAPMAAAPNVMPMATAPMVSPLGSPGAPLSVPPKAKGNSGLYIIGVAIVVAAVAAAAIVVLLKRPEAPAAAAPVPVVAGPTPPPAAAAAALPAAPSDLPVLPSDQPKAEDPTASGAKGSRSTARRSAPKTPTSSSPSSAPASSSAAPSAATSSDGDAPKPKKSKCNCRPGDLMCAMKCSSK